jgi:hypothetical protein
MLVKKGGPASPGETRLGRTERDGTGASSNALSGRRTSMQIRGYRSGSNSPVGVPRRYLKATGCVRIMEDTAGPQKRGQPAPRYTVPEPFSSQPRGRLTGDVCGTTEYAGARAGPRGSTIASTLRSVACTPSTVNRVFRPHFTPRPATRRGGGSVVRFHAGVVGRLDPQGTPVSEEHGYGSLM